MQISVTDETQSLAKLVERARKEPVVLRHDDRDVAVLLSATEYRLMTRDKWDAFLRSSLALSKEAQANGPTEEKLNDLLAEIDAEAPR